MIQTGQSLPQATFKVMTAEGLQERSTQDIFKGKKVVLFAVPGAFTPTCSAKHLPGYVNHFEELKEKGVDLVACLAVNDAFVMDAWAKSCQVDEKVMMLSDGNGAFTKAIELELDAGDHGMGTRSQRYAMIVEDGVVTQLNVEAPGAFEVSDVNSILAALI